MKLNNTENSKENKPRTYRKSVRAKTEKANYEAILGAAYKAFSEQPFDVVTLNDIAEQSGVTVQTVIRRFGSKKELFEAMVEREGKRILEERDVPDEAGLESAIHALLQHYERDGDTILKFVEQEQQFEPVRSLVNRGRQTHREWIQKHCRHVLSGLKGKQLERATHAAIAATDLSTWKLLRRDLKLIPEEVAAVMIQLVNGLKKE